MKTYLTTRSNDIFEDAFNGLFRPFYTERKLAVMQSDIVETEKAFALSVDLPGFDKADISLKFDGDYLVISAKRQEKSEGTKYLHRERVTSCARSYYLGDVDKKSIKAKFENGVLLVEIPKANPEETAMNITIE